MSVLAMIWENRLKSSLMAVVFGSSSIGHFIQPSICHSTAAVFKVVLKRGLVTHMLLLILQQYLKENSGTFSLRFLMGEDSST